MFILKPPDARGAARRGFSPQVAGSPRGGDEDLEERLAIRPTSEVIIARCTRVDQVVARSAVCSTMGDVVAGKGHAAVPPDDRIPWQGGKRPRDRGRGRGRDDAHLALYKDSPKPSWRCRSSTARRATARNCRRVAHVLHLRADGGWPRPAGGHVHNFGQNFARRSRFSSRGRDKIVQHAWTTSWGVSTRLIGGLIMTHGTTAACPAAARGALPGRDRADRTRQSHGWCWEGT